MADIFTMDDARNLLQYKRLIFFGDSNTRAVYKDLVHLVACHKLLSEQQLKNKLERSFMGDKLVKGSALTRGRNFEEQRHFKTEKFDIKFYFITRTYNSTIENVATAIRNGVDSPPDAIFMNSCVWDLSRWGPDGVSAYKQNLVRAMKLFKKSLPPETQFVWITTLPVSQNCRGGFFIKQVEFLKYTLRFDVMEANMFARDVVASYGFDVLDLHYYCTMQISRRCRDGIHWMPAALRFMTNTILTHIALSWEHPLPGNITNSLLDDRIRLNDEAKQQSSMIVDVPLAADTCTKATVEPSSSETATIDNFPRDDAGSSETGTATTCSKRSLPEHDQVQVIYWFDTSNIPNPLDRLNALIASMDKELRLFLVKRRLGPQPARSPRH